MGLDNRVFAPILIQYARSVGRNEWITLLIEDAKRCIIFMYRFIMNILFYLNNILFLSLCGLILVFLHMKEHKKEYNDNEEHGIVYHPFHLD